jgi:TonB-linked SusC/RagA family outer membrane protein
MKKNEPIRGYLCHSLKKTLLIMRIAVILLLVGFLQTRANDSYSQKTKLSVDFSNTKLVTVLDQIENKSEFFFLYNEKMIDTNRKVSIKVKDQGIDDVLQSLFAGTDVSYSIIDRKIILTPTVNSVISQQQKSISGKVTDSSGSPIPGVSVVVKGTTTGRITDGDGNFTLSNISENAILQFSFVGMKAQEIAVTGKTNVNVIMVEDAIGIEEVVAVGYGTQKKVNLTGSIATVDKKILENRPITNSTLALQGATGVYVNQSSGRPGADNGTIRIRGIGTLSDSNPLVLVDGIEYDLRDVNPSDIESISVLKDAASSAIYGNRAANGVILVKTKTGQKGSLKVDYSMYLGSQSIMQVPPDIVTDAVEYMVGKNRALTNEGKPIEYAQTLIDEYKAGVAAGTDPWKYSNTNWMDVMFKNAPIQEHNLRFSGGSEKTTFSASLGYLDQDGILLNTYAKKYNINLNLSSEVNKSIKIGASLMSNYTLNTESGYTTNDANGEGGLMGLIYRGLPMQAPLAKDGTYADHWVRVPGHNFFRNPYALAYEGFHTNKSQRTLASVNVEFKLPFNIFYKVTGSANLYNMNEKFANPVIYLTNTSTGVINPMGNIPARGVIQRNFNNLNLTNFHTLNWNKSIGANELSALLGFSLESFESSNFSAQNQGYLGNELTELSAGSTNPLVSGTSAKSSLMSYFGRLNYSYKGKYLLEGNFRYDGSSRFAKGNQWGLFPSVSLGWRVSEEAFLKNISQISNLKLRTSWGQLGNQNIALFSYVNAVSIGQNYNFNNAVVSGAAITSVSDAEISWETTTMTNIGLDGGLFDNHLTFTMDLFNNLTTGILRQVSIPAQVGNLGGPIKNIGSVSNKGYELSGQYNNKIGQVKFNIGGNIMHVKNNVEDLKGQIYYSGNRITKEGDAIDSFYGLEQIGIFKNKEEIAASPFQNSITQPGDLKFKDLDGNKIIDNNDRKVIGSVIPKLTYGFNLGVEYKNIELTAFFQGVSGLNSIYTGNLSKAFNNGAGVTRNWLTDSWTPENPDAKLPILTTGTGNPLNFQTSSFWVSNTSYLRMKNIQLSYNIPSNLVKRVGLNSLKIYVNALNFLTFSKFKLTDPERLLDKSHKFVYKFVSRVRLHFKFKTVS